MLDYTNASNIVGAANESFQKVPLAALVTASAPLMHGQNCKENNRGKQLVHC